MPGPDEAHARRRRPVTAASLPPWPRAFDPAAELDWGDPTASRRLLREHLDQAHDGASRRLPEIERHLVRLTRLLPPGPLRVLDAACGPGLYAVRLARRGHEVVGTDIGPAVLAHARHLARDAGVARRAAFVRWDLRQPPPQELTVFGPEGFDACLLIYHVLEGFPRAEQRLVLSRLKELLRPGGVLIVELRARPDQPPGRLSHWEPADLSLLSDRRHLLLVDSTWDRRRRLYVLREVAILDNGTVAVQQTTGALTTLEGARDLVRRAGLRVRAVYDGWSRFHATGLSESLLVVAERLPG
ncbi:MAG TPA: class I SAM-dependent methyltransferase [Candidatus Dormibacteraeota bacterium]